MQFDSRPLKVKNRPITMCVGGVQHTVGKLLIELQVCFRPHPNWSLETKNHSDVGAVGKHREYYMGEGDGFLRVRAVVSQVSPCCLWLVPTPRVLLNVN
jgi:hypothetical protein